MGKQERTGGYHPSETGNYGFGKPESGIPHDKRGEQNRRRAMRRTPGSGKRLRRRGN